MAKVDQVEVDPNGETTMLVARPLKPRRLSLATTASGDDGWATPNANGYDDSIENEMGLSMDGHRVRHYRPVPAPLGGEKWGPCLPPSPYSQYGMPITPTMTPTAPFLSSGPPTPSGLMGDASQRDHRTIPAQRAEGEDYDFVVQGLSLLARLVSGPSIPNLPPCGCYGGLEVSSHISEALGVNEADAIKKAADGHGDKPVKVIMEKYPNIRVFADQTKPAKLPDPNESMPPPPPPVATNGMNGMAPPWQHGQHPHAHAPSTPNGCQHLVLPPPGVPPSPVATPAIPR